MSVIADLRKSAGLTQAQVASLAGVQPRQVQRWEAGQARVPKLVIETLQKLQKQ